jgi:hypothetical protein
MQLLPRADAPKQYSVKRLSHWIASPYGLTNGPYPFCWTEKQAWDKTGKEKETGKKNQEPRTARAHSGFQGRGYSLAEKREKPISQLTVDLGARGSVLRRWTQQSREVAQGGLRPFPGHGLPREEEPARLRKEAKALREANQILKKAAEL